MPLLQVIFMISSEPAPMLEDKEKWWVPSNTTGTVLLLWVVGKPDKDLDHKTFSSVFFSMPLFLLIDKEKFQQCQLQSIYPVINYASIFFCIGYWCITRFQDWRLNQLFVSIISSHHKWQFSYVCIWPILWLDTERVTL